MPALHEQVKTLKKSVTQLKRDNTRLQNMVDKFGDGKLYTEKAMESAKRDLQMQLEAAEKRANELADQLTFDQQQVAVLNEQKVKYQQMFEAFQSVTTWR